MDTAFKKNSSNWLPVFDKYYKQFKAKKLRGILKSYVGRAKKRIPKITYLELNEDNVELSTEFFSVGSESVDFFPIPFEWEHDTYSKKEKKKKEFEHSEAMIVWRLSIVGSNRDMGDQDDEAVDDGIADQVSDMLASM